MSTHLTLRIRRIQRFLGVEADGIIGVGTLTALERKLFGEGTEVVGPEPGSLTVSRKGLKLLVQFEIGSRSYYKKFLSKPTCPGGESGVTIGIGYDLGYNKEKQIRSDWVGLVSDTSLERLLVTCGMTGESARLSCKNLEDISIPIGAAEDVFYRATLPRFARLTARLYPGVDNLAADAQAGLLSLVYNRGASTSGSSRREMKAIKQLVTKRAYADIADQILSMRRLWLGKGLQGLLDRRDAEAKLIRNAVRQYKEEELVQI